ncbi:MAG: pyridoxamine 5'-phosphate oxidase family protein [Alphaproteobacteria bacterium]|nr:pyridoxamine 5'-phosphate oxidase family protein [Alphaproteobacteria bacterium]
MLPEKAVLCWLATVDARSRPNVSPKEIFAQVAEDHLVIADIASAQSVRNIRANPAVCVSLIDIFLQRGQKLEGSARIIAPDQADFPVLVAPLLEMTGGRFPIRHVISVHIARRSAIRAPSYAFFPERSEEELRADAYRTYGVQPISTNPLSE